MSAITSHVLDTSLGTPARNVGVTLVRLDAYDAAEVIGEGRTDTDGRVKDLVEGPVAAGRYGLTFDTGAYFMETRRDTFYPLVTVLFEIKDPLQHYHIPLLISPFGYSTYRGS